MFSLILHLSKKRIMYLFTYTTEVLNLKSWVSKLFFSPLQKKRLQINIRYRNSNFNAENSNFCLMQCAKKKYRERERKMNWWSNIIDRITFETWKFLTSWYNGIMLSMKTSHVDILTPNIVIWTWTSVIFFLFSERKIAFEIITWNVSCLFICVLML